MDIGAKLLKSGSEWFEDISRVAFVLLPWLRLRIDLSVGYILSMSDKVPSCPI
jgi:hypothetical protein